MAGLYLEPTLRPCYVKAYKSDEKKPWIVKEDGTRDALFHCWEHYSTVVAPSLGIGGHPGGAISNILGIVEYANGSIDRVKPEDIIFVDHKFEEYCCFVKKEQV